MFSRLHQPERVGHLRHGKLHDWRWCFDVTLGPQTHNVSDSFCNRVALHPDHVIQIDCHKGCCSSEWCHLENFVLLNVPLSNLDEAAKVSKAIP